MPEAPTNWRKALTACLDFLFLFSLFLIKFIRWMLVNNIIYVSSVLPPSCPRSPQRTQAPLVRPFVLLSNPKCRNNATGTWLGEGDSPITALMNLFSSNLPHIGTCGPSTPRSPARAKAEGVEGAPFGRSNPLNCAGCKVE